ncbi:Asp23/Gls24 family envelope stress response protein [Streptomyces sp. HC44]|uniref:Asp23/Gls24 family envelope stress response protein n=1 Tax=Streptomyces scabichelini TaxID=2711217 RepID=A0A6G4V4S8_9ACTN|nr:Asp23/Gls24 family envelope stress response protein [Streptomyces scabichelini]
MTGELATSGAPLRPGSPGRTVAPAERGAIRIADRVVAKIASQAAREALDVLPPDAVPPHATVVVHHDVARVRINLELDYPSDIGAQCAAVRRQVAQRVRMLAGMQVPEVAVQVERLHSAQARAAQGRTQ